MLQNKAPQPEAGFVKGFAGRLADKVLVTHKESAIATMQVAGARGAVKQANIRGFDSGKSLALVGPDRLGGNAAKGGGEP